MRNCSIFTLSNGMRVVHQYIPTTAIVHCGIFVGIGSRDEQIANQGIAHFWEHMAFKGTRKRTSLDIIKSLDSIGGELNAFTDKEKIVFYASVRKEYFERALDVLTDITFHSTFPEKELEKERGVILEEMAMYFDSPDDSLQDEMEALIYKDHPMGMNILGNEQTVRNFRKKDFVSFFTDHADSRKIVFSCIGNITLEEVEQLVKKYLDRIPRLKARASRKKFTKYKKGENSLKRGVKQTRCALGRTAYPLLNEKRIPLYLMTNILGGPGMNSRLNLSVREKHGLVYSIDAQYLAYADTGMFAIYFGTEPKQAKKCLALVHREMDKLCEKKLSARELASAKEQIKGQLAMSEENNLGLMIMMGRAVIDLDRVPPLQETFDKIEAVDALTLQTVAQETFDPRHLSYLTMEPDLK
ncbi:Predicted Zn-dependent peptidase [Chryseolinea serpens]|uniref:Predicted Zn-dependent peptidase n=1 Tax=Chryseolinea serpens TaxID=947013 RepID=A0A1M5TKK1_9BACT|nr:pitrilysin family protein [Chryseolinea serpens]SHH51190.1 Predicted Zn-dependent peptidase [Chryseolinea serpens]